MIHAKDALRLPGAQLTDNQREIVAKLLKEIDAGVHTNMKANGFEFSTNNTDQGAQFEVNYLLEEEYGFNVQCTPLLERSRFKQDEITHTGYKLVCVPSKDSIRASRAAQA